MSETYTPLKLDDLAPVPTVVSVKTAYGRTLTVRIMPLTAAQWAEIGGSVPTPPDLLQAGAAEDERRYRRLVAALEMGGNHIPGETLADKAFSLRQKADNGVLTALYGFLVDSERNDEAGIVAAADSFSGITEAIMAVCRKCGWTLGQWQGLSEQEKRLWLAWHFRGLKQRKALLDTLVDGEKLTPEAYVMLANSE